MEYPGFRILKDAFDRFVQDQNGADIEGRIVRTFATGAKSAVEKGTEEFPKEFIQNLATDFYAFVSSQEIADGISISARSFDEEKVKEMLDQAVDTLKQDEVAEKIAQSIKDTLEKTPTDDLEHLIDAALQDSPMATRMLVKVFFERVKPQIDEMRELGVEDIADRLKQMADTIPTDALAAQVAALTREITPERVSKQAHDLVGKLPTPTAVSDVLHDLGDAASRALDDVAANGTVKGAGEILGEFSRNAKEIVSRTLSNDNQSKKTFKKKPGGGSFDM